MANVTQAHVKRLQTNKEDKYMKSENASPTKLEETSRTVPASTGTAQNQPIDVEVELIDSTQDTTAIAHRKAEDPEGTDTPPSAPDAKRKALEQLRMEAQEETQMSITNVRVQLHQLLQELERLPGNETYEGALLAIVKESGTHGISTSALHQVFPDTELLRKAREKLVTSETIKALKKGNSWILKVA